MPDNSVLLYTEELCKVLVTSYEKFSSSGDVSQVSFTIEPGRKYLKVVADLRGQRSVHCFVDGENGNVYKAASWKAPAKGFRYNLLSPESRERCFRRADWLGSYLYLRP